MMEIQDYLIRKSIEAFILSIEIYNKPTIKYRVEGFSFFICNAWELMLKAHLIKTVGEDSIYYKDNQNRTINLENCIKIIFTNNKDPLRINLEKIIELRNTSTHFITEEYEMVYAPLFQACVLNFIAKLNQFHQVDVIEIIPDHFVNLLVSLNSMKKEEVKSKYPEKISKKLIDTNEDILNLMSGNNDKFAITIRHEYYITKDKSKASGIISIDKTSEIPCRIIKELKDPNETHKFTARKLCEEVTKRLKRQNISIMYKGDIIDKFNISHFNMFNSYYDIKSQEKLCYTHKHFKQPSYSYSNAAIELIVEEIKKDPEHILDNIKRNLTKKDCRVPTPGAKEF